MNWKSVFSPARVAGVVAMLAASAFTADAAVLYTFEGTCGVGCSGTGTGYLYLNDGYVIGDPITSPDFLSFTYLSNVHSFTISSPLFSFVMGAMVTGPTVAYFNVSDGTNEFKSEIDGTWLTNNLTILRSGGSAHTWTASEVPEPSTWVMFGIGVAGLFARRKR